MCFITQSCLTLCHPMDCSLPGSSVHGILQARILEWVAFPSPRHIKEILYSEDLLQRVWWGTGGLEQTPRQPKLCRLLIRFSLSVMSDSWWPHGPQYARLPCPLPTPRACANSCPLSQWCHPTISSSVVPISCLQSFQHQGLFQWVSSLHQMTKVLELQLQLQHQSFQWIFQTDFFEDWLVWSPYSTRDTQVFSNTSVQKHQFFSAWFSV